MPVTAVTLQLLLQEIAEWVEVTVLYSTQSKVKASLWLQSHSCLSKEKFLVHFHEQQLYSISLVSIRALLMDLVAFGWLWIW